MFPFCLFPKQETFYLKFFDSKKSNWVMCTRMLVINANGLKYSFNALSFPQQMFDTNGFMSILENIVQQRYIHNSESVIILNKSKINCIFPEHFTCTSIYSGIYLFAFYLEKHQFKSSIILILKYLKYFLRIQLNWESWK